MSSLTDDIAALEKAIRRGVNSVSYKDRKVDYRSLDEMERTLARMKREAGESDSTRKRTTPTYDRGL